ncbi:MAG TPA: N-acylglucosamine 2-epimerase, partial [Streptosporangiaceae bacterium]
PDDEERFGQVRGRLLTARESRARPGRDDKVVTAWNGLAIAALAECGLLLTEPGFTRAASEAADLLVTLHLRDGELIRTSRSGVAGPSAAVLEDYACLAEALLVLSGVTGQAHWVPVAGQLLEVALARFGNGSGGFYDTADNAEPLMYRPADPADGPTPSGNFAVAGALLSYAALTGSARHRDAAAAALGVLAPIASRYPRAAGAGLAVAEAMIAGPSEIAVVGPPGDPRTGELHRAALLAAPPGAVLALGDGSAANGDQAGSGRPGPEAVVPLLAGRGLVGGAPAVYVCRGFTCRMPVTDPIELRGALSYPAKRPADLDRVSGVWAPA